MHPSRRQSNWDVSFLGSRESRAEGPGVSFAYLPKQTGYLNQDLLTSDGSPSNAPFFFRNLIGGGLLWVYRPFKLPLEVCVSLRSVCGSSAVLYAVLLNHLLSLMRVSCLSNFASIVCRSPSDRPLRRDARDNKPPEDGGSFS